jgi:preprotein translocase subunit YajC
MPAGKRRQSNATLYTLITFVGLFIVATTVAVIYYVKAEELRTQAKEAQDKANALATADEYRNLGGIVGQKGRGQSNLGTMVTRLDEMVLLVKGAPVEATSAEVKVANATKAVMSVLQGAGAYITLPAPEPNATAADPNAPAQPAEPNAVAPRQVALTTVISDLLAKLNQTTELKKATEKQLSDLQKKFNDAIATWDQTQQKLAADVDQYRQQVDRIKTDYNDLQARVEKSSAERAQLLTDQIEQAKNEAKQLNQDLLRTQAELNVAQGRLQGALTQVAETRPAPDKEAPAFKPDGEVILVDDAAGVIRINLGADDHVYRGLTFSIYDRSAGIPRDGKPKAEVEVFAIDPKVSAARVLSSEKKNPIVTGDLAANLIWNAGKENQFVVAGEFDVNGDGKPDYDGIRKLEALIQRWGGVVASEVSATTDFVVLGKEPFVPAEPTLEQQAQDPTAKEKFDAIRQSNERYNQVRQRAEALWVPIFNYDRFLHFTGYASQIGKPGAF